MDPGESWKLTAPLLHYQGLLTQVVSHAPLIAKQTEEKPVFLHHRGGGLEKVQRLTGLAFKCQPTSKGRHRKKMLPTCFLEVLKTKEKVALLNTAPLFNSSVSF